METDAFDQYLAQCVEAHLRSRSIPAWPADLAVGDREAALRVTFHGIALLLVETTPELPGWPTALMEAIKQEARVQSFWELSHAKIVAELVEALEQVRQPALILKGTALAYAYYRKPAIRRRGDSDLLVENADRAVVRSVLEACGFSPCGDARPLQEAWRCHSAHGFDHVVDLHWRISASSAVSGLLEANLPKRKLQDIPELSPHARSVGSIDNLILVCLNRAQHGKFGYLIGRDRLFDNDRLIWAADIDLIVARFDSGDWDELIESASICGASDIVGSGLRLAHQLVGTPIPVDALARLDEQSGDMRLSSYLANTSAKQRFKLDLAASPTLGDKLRLIVFKLLPSEDLVRERYPDAGNWPLALLHARRLLAGLGALVRGGV